MEKTRVLQDFLIHPLVVTNSGDASRVKHPSIVLGLSPKLCRISENKLQHIGYRGHSKQCRREGAGGKPVKFTGV